MFYIIGLGNPGEEYKESRHNSGRQAVDYYNESKIKNKELRIKIIGSDQFMNHSGRAVAKVIKSKKSAQNLIVVYDDIDLPLGSLKISYNKSSGGHRGLESIIKAIKTREFTRIRIGIAPTSTSGKIKKPVGETKVLDFILGTFKPTEKEILKKIFKKVVGAVETIVEEGREIAMNRFN
ncbi:MAG: aminoacyl-tRNA hydrolase [Patescibacteria group bacterium]